MSSWNCLVLSSEYFSSQAGPVIKVKIPKDKDGKLKQFAFMNFKHEVSVPYAMNLLNGIKLFRRPIKIQFRSGCSHASQDASMSYPQHRVGNLSPTSTSPNRYCFSFTIKVIDQKISEVKTLECTSEQLPSWWFCCWVAACARFMECLFSKETGGR